MSGARGRFLANPWNLEICTCGAESCERRGKCCECIAFHLSVNSLPNCANKMLAAQKSE